MPSPPRWGVLGTGARQEGLEPQATELWKPLTHVGAQPPLALGHHILASGLNKLVIFH